MKLIAIAIARFRRRIGGFLYQRSVLPCAASLGMIASATAAGSITTEPAQPRAFEPFDVLVQYSKEYCLPRSTPIVSQVISGSPISGRFVYVVLSHLAATDPVACTPRSVSKFRLPGLPPGEMTLGVAITVTTQPLIFVYRSEIAETVSAPISVSSLSSAPQKVMTIIGPNGLPFYLSTIDAMNLSGTGSLLPSPGAGASTPSFYAWTAPSGPTQAVPPTVTSKLFSLRLSSPVRYFYTTSAVERDALLRAGLSEQDSPPGALYVLPAINGACPLGTAPVRRLFNPADVLHRYEMNTESVAVLAANGYVDENIAFCSPPAP